MSIKMKVKISSFVLFIIVFMCARTEAGDNRLDFSSSIKQNILIEYFSSNTCSQCLSGVDFMNNYRTNKKVFNEIFPITFFEYDVPESIITVMQKYSLFPQETAQTNSFINRRLDKYLGNKHIYRRLAPLYIANGRGWRPGVFVKIPNVLRKNVGKLSVDIIDRQVEVKFHNLDKNDDNLNLSISILAMNFDLYIAGKKEVKKNNSFILVHQKYYPGVNKNNSWILTLPDKLVVNGNQQYAIVVWVNRPNDQTPVQVTGGILNSSILESLRK